MLSGPSNALSSALNFHAPSVAGLRELVTKRVERKSNVAIPHSLGVIRLVEWKLLPGT